MTKPKWVVPNNTLRQGTGSTVAIYARIRSLLLAHVTPQGERLADYLGSENVWVRAHPQPPTFPYLTLRLDRVSTPWASGYRETAQLEVQAIGQPEAQLPVIESAMDIVDGCLLSLTDNDAGLMVGRTRQRGTIPQFTDPADSTVVGVVATYDLILWPTVLTTR
jgi:hypothetical protein